MSYAELAISCRNLRWLVARVDPRRSRRAVAAAFVLVLLLASVGCQRQAASGAPERQPASEPQVKRVEVAAAALRDWPEVIRVQGSLWGDEEAVIGAKVAGRVAEVAVDVGSPVRQGDLLAALEREELDLRVKQALAQWAQARASLGLSAADSEEDLDPHRSPPVLQEKALLEEARYNAARASELVRQKLAAAELLEQREAALRVAEARHAAALNGVHEKIALLGVRRAELDLARRALADAAITAPFHGVVQQRHVAPGVYLQVGDPVVTLVRTDPLRFRTGVPERYALRLAPGQSVRITIEGLQQPIDARIARISPALDVASRALWIEADVRNPEGRLRAGLFAEAEITVAADERRLAIPDSAVSQFAGVHKVWRVHEGEAREQAIETGRREGGLVEVLSGLEPGELVVLHADQGHAGRMAVVRPPQQAVEHAE